MWRNMSGPLGHARYMRAIFSGVNLTVLPDWRRVGGLRGGAPALTTYPVHLVKLR
jgi:hypothetical protein